MVAGPITVGVLALQGSFAEHIHSINSLSPEYNVHAIPVRTPLELARCDGLILPGGESTAISLLITKSGLYEPLREFVRVAKSGEVDARGKRKSIWGTCAGMILLATEIKGPIISEGWQGLDGIDVRVGRNSYGRQLQSFSHPLELEFLPKDSAPLVATFIRAPILDEILLPRNDDQALPVIPLARIPKHLVPPLSRRTEATTGHVPVDAQGSVADVVMYRQGNLVASSWHPELNKDDHRVHDWFVRQVVLGLESESAVEKTGRRKE
ncbi:putative pyridoxal 5'-phosphate synthase [Sporobolomyces koalae]|uniref:putative pyridoxal 5'-phosphate synthase n=1 Tax=Sporobolomyces koalae TaxID=500713 RepID=UPI003173EDEC